MNFSDFILNDKKLEKKIYDKYNLDNNPDKKKEKNQKNKEYKREKLPSNEKRKLRNNLLNDYKMMNDEEKEKYIAKLGDQLTSDQRNADFYPGCDDKLVDVELRKDSKSIQKIIQMNTKARVFDEDTQMNELYKINSLL